MPLLDDGAPPPPLVENDDEPEPDVAAPAVTLDDIPKPADDDASMTETELLNSVAEKVLTKSAEKAAKKEQASVPEAAPASAAAAAVEAAAAHGAAAAADADTSNVMDESSVMAPSTILQDDATIGTMNTFDKVWAEPNPKNASSRSAASSRASSDNVLNESADSASNANNTTALSAVAGSEVSQSVAAAEIGAGAEGFEDVEGQMNGDGTDKKDDGAGDPPLKKGGNGPFCKKSTIVLSVLAIIVAAAITIGVLVGVGVISFSGSSSSPAQQSNVAPAPEPVAPPEKEPICSPQGEKAVECGAKPKPLAGRGELCCEGLVCNDEKRCVPIVESTKSSTPRPTVTPGEPTASPTTGKPSSLPTPIPTLPTVFDRSKEGPDYEAAVAISGMEAVTTPGTPQYEALKWLMNDDPLQITVVPSSDPNVTTSSSMWMEGMMSVDDDRFLQRYSLATVIFALTEEEEDTGNGNAEVEEEDGGMRRQLTRQRRYLKAAELLPAGIDECDLDTIKCNDEGKIKKMDFRKLDLKGKIPNEINKFWLTLTEIDFSYNDIRGTIPESFYDLYWLEGLYLNANKLTGTLSSKISKLTSLRDLYLGENDLTGTLTLGLASDKNIRNLSVYRNKFAGSIPDWGKLNSLFMLDLGYNKMTGTLPESLTNRRTLRILYLNDNQFTGTIPESYTTLGTKKLKELHLNDNKLTGQVPADWRNDFNPNKHLLALRVENNDLSGKIDWQLCNMDVRGGTAEMVELGADCDICSCKLCEPYCSN